MQYNFDEIIDRRNTNSLKYDFAKRRGMPEDILPLWVADMDFKAPPCIIDALVDKSRHGIFGYSEAMEEYDQILQNWFLNNFNWRIDPRWLIKTPGVVYALCSIIRALTEKGDAVLIQQPVYYPFTESVLDNERKLVVNQLVYSQGKYSIDFDDFENKIIENNVKLFILCSPHNPVGRVWTAQELIKLGDICLKHNVIVASDEIHADFVYPGHKHLVFASLKPEFKENSITLTSPSKTFNLAGLQISNIFIPNQQMRRKVRSDVFATGYSQLNIMGIVSCKAAYSEGYEWLSQLRNYLLGNLNYLREFLIDELPQIKLIEPDGTYLIWLNCKELGLDDKELDELIIHKAGLWLDSGHIFGAGGEGFQRINIACPREILKRAFFRFSRAVNSIK